MGQQGLYGAVPLVHYFCRQRVGVGDSVVDATCGNGQDTLLLAELVGAGGKVWAFDIQEVALARTEQLLRESGCHRQVELIHAGHERLAELVTGPVQAVVFNLGYLPAGDKDVRTSALTTLAALAQATELLAPGGLLLLAIYTSHDQGEEGTAVQDWCAGLDPKRFNVWQARQLNRSTAAPYLIVVEKTTTRQ